MNLGPGLVTKKRGFSHGEERLILLVRSIEDSRHWNRRGGSGGVEISLATVLRSQMFWQMRPRQAVSSRVYTSPLEV